MDREFQNAESIGIIGGADGPTSIFIAGKKVKMPFKVRINQYVYKCRRKRAAKEIVAGTHTLEEMVEYAMSTFGATQANNKLGDLPAVSRIYEIKAGSNCLDIEIDDARGTFGVSFSGSNKEMKQFKKIVRDLYVYYGVSEKDIKEKTERYFALLGVLCV